MDTRYKDLKEGDEVMLSNGVFVKITSFVEDGKVAFASNGVPYPLEVAWGLYLFKDEMHKLQVERHNRVMEVLTWITNACYSNKYVLSDEGCSVMEEAFAKLSQTDPDYNKKP